MVVVGMGVAGMEGGGEGVGTEGICAVGGVGGGEMVGIGLLSHKGRGVDAGPGRAAWLGVAVGELLLLPLAGLELGMGSILVLVLEAALLGLAQKSGGLLVVGGLLVAGAGLVGTCSDSFSFCASASRVCKVSK